LICIELASIVLFKMQQFPSHVFALLVVPELKWSSHDQWPRSVPAESAGGDAKKASRRRSQKDWQAETKWKWRIVALTLPTLGAPIVTYVEI
jgi:hypothetical protein